MRSIILNILIVLWRKFELNYCKFDFNDIYLQEAFVFHIFFFIGLTEYNNFIFIKISYLDTSFEERNVDKYCFILLIKATFQESAVQAFFEIFKLSKKYVQDFSYYKLDLKKQ